MCFNSFNHQFTRAYRLNFTIFILKQNIISWSHIWETLRKLCFKPSTSKKLFSLHLPFTRLISFSLYFTSASFPKVTLPLINSFSDKNLFVYPCIWSKQPLSTYEWFPWFCAYNTRSQFSFFFSYHTLGCSFSCKISGLVWILWFWNQLPYAHNYENYDIPMCYSMEKRNFYSWLYFSLIWKIYFFTNKQYFFFDFCFFSEG